MSASSQRERILLIDDEAPLRESLGYAFGREGFDVNTAADGAAGLDLARKHPPDVVLLDIMLPQMDGYEVCRRIREQSDVPVLMLTARDQVHDRLTGFDSGADDYVTKPFNTRELLARVRALLRRHSRVQQLIAEDRALLSRLEDSARNVEPTARSEGPSGVLIAGPIVLDSAQREVTVSGETQRLSAAEARLLECLARERGRVVTRTELVRSVWGERPDGLLLLEVHVRMLRAKLETDPANPDHLVTVPGIGYQLR